MQRGASWIETVKARSKGVSYALDGFHLQKYLVRLTSHMKNSADDVYRELRRAIRRGTKADFCEIVGMLKNALPKESEETGSRRLYKSRDYNPMTSNDFLQAHLAKLPKNPQSADTIWKSFMITSGEKGLPQAKTCGCSAFQ